jgi:hypothetical protein
MKDYPDINIEGDFDTAEGCIEALEAKAVAALEKQIDEGSFQATKYALDAAGYAAAKKIDIDATTTYTIVVDE